MLLAQQLLKILKAIDSAVEAYFVDEVIDYFDLMDLLLQLWLCFFLLLWFFVYKDHLYLRHIYYKPILIYNSFSSNIIFPFLIVKPDNFIIIKSLHFENCVKKWKKL